MTESFDRKFRQVFLLKLVFKLVSWEAGLGWDLGLGFPLGTGLGWLGYRGLGWSGLGRAGGAGAGVLRPEPDFLKLGFATGN